MGLILVMFDFVDPNIMKKLQVDRGAIKFVLSGANVMCPGLTSPGGALDVEVPAESPVVYAFLDMEIYFDRLLKVLLLIYDLDNKFNIHEN